MEKIEIDVPFRIHLNLHALHQCKLRKNGGLGFGVKTKCKLIARKSISSRVSVDGTCSDMNKINSIVELLDLIKKCKGLDHSIDIIIKGDLYFHCGLGVGTAITLAAIESLLLINNKSSNPSEIQTLSKRGGTSGIGIHSYFEGGMILDGGIYQDDQEHLPSNAKSPNNIPLKILRIPLPDWYCLYAIPRNTGYVSGEEEKRFFQTNTPISKEDAYEATYSSVMGVIPSVLENNYEVFRRAISDIQQSFWKSKEISVASIESIFLISLGKKLGIACGMSSFGSGVYFVGEKALNSIYQNLKSEDYHLLELNITNTGRCINFV